MAVVRSGSMSMSVMRMSLQTKWLSSSSSSSSSSSVGLLISSSRNSINICQRGILKTHHHSLSLRKPLSTAASALENDQTTTAVTAAAAESDYKLINEMSGMLDIRVGLIVRAWKHPEADSLYVQEVDIGDNIIIQNQDDNNNNNNVESAPPSSSASTSTSTSLRLICSGLVNYMPLHLLQDRKVVVLANLKPRNMRGVKSFGMLMAASDSSHENVELLEPPESSLPGDRIWFGDVDQNDNLPEAASPNQIQKKKIWELVQPHLKTNSSCVAVLGEDVMRTSAGVVRCRSLKDANVS